MNIQTEYQKKVDLMQQITYWQENLDKPIPIVDIPSDYSRSHLSSTVTKNIVKIKLESNLNRELSQFCRSQHFTTFIPLLAALKALLGRYTGQEDIIVGSVSADSLHPDTQKSNFVNLIALRTNIISNFSVKKLIDSVAKTVREAALHGDYPFSRIVTEVLEDQELTNPGIFQVMLVPCNGEFELSGVPVTVKHLEKISQYSNQSDIVILTEDTPTGLEITWEYNAELFTAESIERMLGHWQMLLQGIIAHPEQDVATLPLLSAAEKHQLLVEWNDTQQEYPQDKCIHELFEQQVAINPDAVAMVFGDDKLTYGELNQRANQLAHYLMKLGAQPDTLVGISVERSPEMIVGLLGILKAGAAYVPLDPTYPPERLAYMLSDAQMPILLTTSELVAELPEHQAQVICLDTDWENIAQHSQEDLQNQATAENLAYVLYTSGSSGKPKGVCCHHLGVVNLLADFEQKKPLCVGNNCSFWTSLNFDVSVYEIFSPLLVGATLHIVPESLRYEAIAFFEWLEEHQINSAYMPPFMLHYLTEWLEKNSRNCSLQRLLVGVEPIIEKLLVTITQQVSGLKIINGYGPTEATICATVYPVSPDSTHDKNTPIGKPVQNTEIYLLDSQLKPVPVNVSGELYIASPGLARGYLNRPQLTAEKFIANPFKDSKFKRLYQTGDLARYLADGNIEFLGRIDHQVKIRGFRIEIEEIETALRQHPEVRETVVLAREESPGNKRLVAYLVSGKEGSSEAQREQLGQWQQVVNATYSQLAPAADPTLNIIGWTNSYTGKPIPQSEMREWAEQTSNRILSYKPNRVLEIGCGSGILLFRIAPHCSYYHGIDISQEALHYIQQQVSVQNWQCEVALSQRAADNFENIEPASLDSVIINSVIQFFPSVDYLVDVLEKAVKTVVPGGFIFLGDLRSLTLLFAFHASIQLHQAPDSLSIQQLQQRIQNNVDREEDLIVDPDFFIALKEHLPQISHVEIQLKGGRYQNELTKFRYDVVLHIGKEESSPIEPSWLDWQKEQLNLSSVRQLLATSQPEMLGIKNVPNARLLSEIKLLQLLDTGKYATIEELRCAWQQENGSGVEPEDWWELTAELPYTTYINWSNAKAQDCYEVVFQKDTIIAPYSHDLSSSSVAKPWSAYVNNPLQSKIASKLELRLRSYLHQRLPDYMVPSAFVILDKMPLTPSGKIDRRALPAPDRSRPELETELVMPQSDAEQLIAEAWQEVLQLDVVGIEDNFFELGGNSLLLTQIYNKLSDKFEAKLSIVMLFQYPTIKTLTQQLSQTASKETAIKKNTSSQQNRKSLSKQQKQLRQKHRQVEKKYDS